MSAPAKRRLFRIYGLQRGEAIEEVGTIQLAQARASGRTVYVRYLEHNNRPASRERVPFPGGDVGQWRIATIADFDPAPTSPQKTDPDED